jgi:hypothetical protein
MLDEEIPIELLEQERDRIYAENSKLIELRKTEVRELFSL